MYKNFEICKSGKEKDFAQTMSSLYNELYDLQIFLQRLMLDLSANICYCPVKKKETFIYYIFNYKCYIFLYYSIFLLYVEFFK